MRITKTLGAEAIRLIQVLPQLGGTIYGIKLVRAFESRYGFLQSPQKLEEFDLSKGVVFLHGFFNNRSVIDQVKIFNGGILATCKDGTETCEAIIDDIIQWATEEAGVKFESPQPFRIYNSAVEVEVSGDFAGSFERFNSISETITTMVRSYGSIVSGYHPTALHFATKVDGPTPNAFRFERREGAPIESNLFYSSAPLTTKDHELVLNLFEAAISSRPTV